MLGQHDILFSLGFETLEILPLEMWLATRGKKRTGWMRHHSQGLWRLQDSYYYNLPLFIQHKAMSSFQDAKRHSLALWPGKENQGISKWLWVQPQEQSHFKKAKHPPNPIKCYFLKQWACFIISSKKD